MFCVLCEKSGRQNIWTTSGCNKFKRDAIQKHTKTSDQLFSIEADNNSGDINRAAQRLAEKDRDVYYLAQRNEPVSAISVLNIFLTHHKISTLQPLKRDGKVMYEHNSCVREMQNAMVQVVNEDLLDDIKHSGVFSLMADESTDMSTEKTLMLYVRYIKDGAPCVKFLDVTELSGDKCNAKTICATILQIMNNYKLNISDMACITTDGASVMTGHRGGVTTLLKERNGHLLSIHCIAHRLALASGQAADKIQYLKKYQAMLNTIFKYFNYSPKHLAKLSKIQQVFELAERKFRQTFHTRWLSFEGAVDAVIANYDALVCCLEMDVAEEDDTTARGLLIFVADYKFLATSYMLSDILSHLGLMSKIFQKRELDLGTCT